MKKIIILSLMVFMFVSCMKDPEYHGLSIEIAFDFGPDVSPEYKGNAKVILNNLQKNYSTIDYTSQEGEVLFTNVEPGFYTVQLIHSYKNESGATVNVNGLQDYQVFSSIQDTMETVVSVSNSLVIKEFYFSGCLTPAENSYSADQYVEIYNNTSSLQYADGLSIVEHESYGTSPNYWTWLKDTIATRMIWTIPGNGNDYPLQPGESVVLARDAFDHQSDPLGNPLSPVNLSHANFEFFVYNASGDDIDGAYSPNLIEDLFTFRGSDVAFHMRGGSAIALVRIPGNDTERKEYIANHLVLKDQVSSTRYYGKIPNNWVIDAVEVVFDEAHAVYKRFPIELDAGYTYNPEGTKSGLCIRRKVKSIVDGRVVYQDTNNSCEDFIKGTEPKPWIYE